VTTPAAVEALSTAERTARWEANVATLRRMLWCISNGDPEGELVHLADDVVYEAPFYATMEARRGQAAMAGMLRAVQDRFATILYEVVDVHPTVDPDHVIAEVRGDHQVLGADRRYQNHYVMFLRFRDGLVVHWREFSNPLVYAAATGEG
jgi:uncharacterized protein